MDPSEAGATAFTIDSDLARAATIDKRFYLDEGVWQQVLERVLARSWQWIGDLGDVAEPFSLSPRDLLPGSLDEPVLLARDAAGTLRCLSNVCTHRAKVVVDRADRAEPQGLRCTPTSRPSSHRSARRNTASASPPTTGGCSRT